MKSFFAAISCAIALLAACRERPGAARDELPVGNFDTARVSILTARDTISLRVELAETPEQKQLGLMERRNLGEFEGMLFVNDEVQDESNAFYMFRTRISLDIAFIDSTGVIVSIRSMEPCPSPNPQVCPTYGAGVPYQNALEVNRGFFARHGITVGDRVVR